MDSSLAGRIAEEVIYGKENSTTGATSDFARMMKLAKDYVLRYGFSEKVDPRSGTRILKESRSDIFTSKMKI